ncbi:MAG: SEC-C metal-binding domain-containing protein [Syntrophobacteraceae bacterium]
MKKQIPVFHACTIKYNGWTDRVITAVKLYPAHAPSPNQPPPFPPHETMALWDTGATKSVITSATVASMNLVPIGTTIVTHAGGSDQANTYLLNFCLPSNVGITGVIASECKNIAGDFGAIIGMDIITKGDFSITNVGGLTCMTFRVPSISTIDYVAEAQTLKKSIVGRNDPCPCRSGKKFKKCCGQNL